jgi:hypothetical protein
MGSMNDFIRKMAGRLTVGGDSQNARQEQPQQLELTPEREERIEKYMSMGVSYAEARDLVLGAPPAAAPVTTPKGNAGAGSGNIPFSGPSMNEFIRAVSGRTVFPRNGGGR